MFDTSDDTKIRRPRRIEVLTGPERRRDWPDSRKIAIVVESLAPGVNVSEIARRHDASCERCTANEGPSAARYSHRQLWLTDGRSSARKCRRQALSGRVP